MADSFDAMSSTRTYRSQLSRSEALNEIHRCTGTQFDPDLAPIFIGLDFTEFDQLVAEHQAEEAEASHAFEAGTSGRGEPGEVGVVLVAADAVGEDEGQLTVLEGVLGRGDLELGGLVEPLTAVDDEEVVGPVDVDVDTHKLKSFSRGGGPQNLDNVLSSESTLKERS